LFTIKKTIDLLTKGKERFGITNQSINIGNKANISLFNPKEKYSFQTKDISSTSKNSIFKNVELQGKAYGIISNNKIVLH
jgi:dihydroorotase